MAAVTLQQITKTFGPLRALNRISLEVHDGEFLTILGPSGSGKTTLLRLVAGLDVPDTGRISVDKRVVCSETRWVAPQARDIGMVFQNYALWPHMTAFENIAFSLETTGVSKAEIVDRVHEMLVLVELNGFENKRPGEMSGGEQQRVALARALVGRPSILLMDECLSNLDARLREKMADELRRVQEVVGITTIYVTHDQHEALALSDRIAVLHQGTLQQVGTPAELYRRPCNDLVAKSLGPVNLLSLAGAQALGLTNSFSKQLDQSARLGLRPEDILIVPTQGNPAVRNSMADFSKVAGKVVKVTFAGNGHDCQVDVDNRLLQARIPALPGSDGRPAGQMYPNLSPGEEVAVVIEPQAWIVFDAG
jgi:iron(III) transport system ATP-binding protein